MPRFNVGDRVWWKSESGGFIKEKHGVVVCVVPAGGSPSRYGRLCAEELGMKAPEFGMGRSYPSFIVHVPGKTPRGKGKLYFPRVQDLENDDA